MLIRDIIKRMRHIIKRMRHDGCGKVELLTGIEERGAGRCSASCCSTADMTSIPDITRMLARIHEWQEGQQPGGRGQNRSPTRRGACAARRGQQHARRDTAGVAGR